MSSPQVSQLVTLEEDESLSRMTTPELGLLDSSDVRNGDRNPSCNLVVSSNEDDRAVTAAEAQRDDEDSFKTPTSSEHKIPELTECPPAPAPKRLENLTSRRGRKRRRSSPSSRSGEEKSGLVEAINLPSEEVESLFQLRSWDDVMEERGNRTMKRARIDHDRDGNPCL